ncbi:MAG: tRNA uridine-5-carboxymethylaminomethyl(34) synthesis GTPase MnmE [Candidatus Omnitrophota bacterium]
MAGLELTDDTIVALATSPAQGAIGIVRLSGPQAVKIADRFFFNAQCKSLEALKTFSMCYGWIVKDKAAVSGRALKIEDFKDCVIDEVVVSVMRGPKSYTREDIVEINSHGGLRVLSSILELFLSGGARMAQPGEFTKRAFLSGRLDLSQAEAVLDVIQAKSELALKNGLSQLSGEVSRCIKDLRARMLALLADMEATLDFSEEESIEVENNGFFAALSGISEELNLLIERGFKARIVREGLRVAIFGRPNTGKSSLLNAILKQERAIVSSIAGTTRDTIEELVSIKGLAVRLVDTAGVLEHRDEIEKEAVARSQRAVEESDLVLFVLDGSVSLSQEDRRLFDLIRDKEKIIVINKNDLSQKLDRSEVERLCFKKPVTVCAFKVQDILALEEEIVANVFQGEGTRFLQEGVMISNVRHMDILKRSLDSLAAASGSLEKGLSMDFAAMDLRKAMDALGELTGEVFTEDLLDVIFSKFCVGK